MTTVIEDKQLDTELQELYLISKHWISDLVFFEKDLKFLEKLFGRAFNELLKQEGYEHIADIMLSVAQIEQRRIKIKNEVISYMHSLELLINKTSRSFDFTLIETYSHIEFELSSLLHSFQSVKQTIFKLTSEGIKAEPSCNIAL